jgi:hypothetical protein
MTAVAVSEARNVARPLSVLVPLIKDDLEKAKEAGLPHYCDVGEKLIEAKFQLRHGAFLPWVVRNFGMGRRQASEYMHLARKHRGTEMGEVIPISVRAAIGDARPDNPNYGKPAPWRADIDEKVKRALEQSKRLQDEALSRKQERDAESKLALQLIDIGYKALASKLHPDKGGSRDAMSRLNRVRARLKQHA